MLLDSTSIKNYYEEIYKLMESQSQILNIIMKVYIDKKVPKDLNDTIKRILHSTRQLNKLSANLLKVKDIHEEEIKLVCLLSDSIDETLSGVECSFSYIHRLMGIKFENIIDGKKSSSFSEKQLFDFLIEKFKKSMNILDEIIKWLENVSSTLKT
ncbi:hypothetical protein [Clostridium estertheticum]|uniref:hypothetical protein n=1 Tax=Clostridium estertheticum TaxID=238834 RepID=UPI001C0B74DA|nr:hypothetical protein [Clostridium estertheticum]MBU3171331.1 hypothetical protein [Clostridium estertheticum]